ncbi:glycosyltransferase [Hydrogenimonas urashimensis]|uniref:glycosyltransferase n=1 Tax=Hydrogenimonas urashimensis TaxID=2740515 RepID=UPI001916BFE5|nr:glycosyltransferase [Hydrogenimonas urashimensis]
MKTENSSSNRPPCIVLFNMTLSGGAGNYIVTLADALAKQGVQTHIVIYKDAVDYAIPQGVQLHKLLAKNRKDLKGELRNLLASLKPVDLILSNSTPSNKILSSLHLPNAMHIVHSAETKTYRGFFAPLKWWWRKRTYRKLYSDKHLITVSKGLQEYIVNTLSARPLSIHTLYNPFNIKEIRHLADQKPKEIPARPYLLHVGRLNVGQKRHDLLLEAYKKAAIPYKLYIVGEGPDRDRIQSLIDQMGLTEQVILQGHSDNPYAWMRHAKLLILSSDYEGFSRVLAEALIVGTPVVSTDCPSGPSEILTGQLKAYLSPPGNFDALALNIQKALKAYPDLSRFDLSHLDAGCIAQELVKSIMAMKK